MKASVKYAIRAAKYFCWFLILFTLLIGVLVLTKFVPYGIIVIEVILCRAIEGCQQYSTRHRKALIVLLFKSPTLCNLCLKQE